MRLLGATAFCCTALALAAVTSPASAAATESATLTCGDRSYLVTGFGRGEPLHVVGSTSTFVVTYARLEPSGRVVTDIKGQRGAGDVVTCTATAPGGSAFTFRGFFTPRG